MKKIIAFLLAIVMLLSLAACGTETPQSTKTQPGASSTEESATEPSVGTTESSLDATTPPESTNKPTEYSYNIDLTGITTLDELEAHIEEHLTTTIASLNAKWESLAAEIDTYDKYVANNGMVSDFYQTVIT